MGVSGRLFTPDRGLDVQAGGHGADLLQVPGDRRAEPFGDEIAQCNGLRRLGSAR
jgi:hypothetical protein